MTFYLNYFRTNSNLKKLLGCSILGGYAWSLLVLLIGVVDKVFFIIVLCLSFIIRWMIYDFVSAFRDWNLISWASITVVWINFFYWILDALLPSFESIYSSKDFSSLIIVFFIIGRKLVVLACSITFQHIFCSCLLLHLSRKRSN